MKSVIYSYDTEATSIHLVCIFDEEEYLVHTQKLVMGSTLHQKYNLLDPTEFFDEHCSLANDQQDDYFEKTLLMRDNIEELSNVITVKEKNDDN
jgi:hypothetical protein